MKVNCGRCGAGQRCACPLPRKITLRDRLRRSTWRGDRAAMEARIGEQLERMGARIVDRVREDRAAILEALATPRDRPGA